MNPYEEFVSLSQEMLSKPESNQSQALFKLSAILLGAFAFVATFVLLIPIYNYLSRADVVNEPIYSILHYALASGVGAVLLSCRTSTYRSWLWNGWIYSFIPAASVLILIMFSSASWPHDIFLTLILCGSCYFISLLSTSAAILLSWLIVKIKSVITS